MRLKGSPEDMVWDKQFTLRGMHLEGECPKCGAGFTGDLSGYMPGTMRNGKPADINCYCKSADCGHAWTVTGCFELGMRLEESESEPTEHPLSTHLSRLPHPYWCFPADSVSGVLYIVHSSGLWFRLSDVLLWDDELPDLFWATCAKAMSDAVAAGITGEQTLLTTECRHPGEVCPLGNVLDHDVGWLVQVSSEDAPTADSTVVAVSVAFTGEAEETEPNGVDAPSSGA